VMSLQCSFGIWKWQIDLLDAISFFLCKAFFAVILLWSPFVARWATLFSCVLEGDMHASGIANAGPFRTNARQS
jgi:hypothetical protein